MIYQITGRAGTGPFTSIFIFSQSVYPKPLTEEKKQSYLKKKHYTTDYKSLKMELVTHAERLLKVSNIV